jgi:nucleoside-diphosphate-sugar epimerase
VHPGAAGEVFNVVDEPVPTAWRYAVEDRRRRGLGRPLPVPYALAFAFVRSAFAAARALLGPKAKVPSLFVPARFEARFKPLAFSAARARQGLGWSPPFGFEEALRRTHEPAPLHEATP